MGSNLDPPLVRHLLESSLIWCSTGSYREEERDTCLTLFYTLSSPFKELKVRDCLKRGYNICSS